MTKKEKQFPRRALLADSRFQEYQPDFLAVILDKPFYSLAEAQKIAEAFFIQTNPNKKKERD